MEIFKCDFKCERDKIEITSSTGDTQMHSLEEGLN